MCFFRASGKATNTRSKRDLLCSNIWIIQDSLSFRDGGITETVVGVDWSILPAGLRASWRQAGSLGLD